MVLTNLTDTAYKTYQHIWGVYPPYGQLKTAQISTTPTLTIAEKQKYEISARPYLPLLIDVTVHSSPLTGTTIR